MDGTETEGVGTIVFEVAEIGVVVGMSGLIVNRSS